jgi:hypothetical protein
MIAPLSVFRLVIDHPGLNFHLSCTEIALEVRRVILGIPKAEFNAGKERHLGRFSPEVGDAHLPDFQILAERDEVECLGLDAIECRSDDTVPHAMAAGVVLGVVARRLPRRRPEVTVRIVAQVHVASADIKRHVVVTIACQAAETCVPIKRVPPRCVGDNAEVGFSTEIINPGKRCVRPGDHILTILVVKVPVDHGMFSYIGIS